jgi:hypothetical protein
MSSAAWVVTCNGCKCVILCFATDPQLEHGKSEGEIVPPFDADIMYPTCTDNSISCSVLAYSERSSSAKGVQRRASTLSSVLGEVFSLDIALYRTRPPRRAASVYSDAAKEQC